MFLGIQNGLLETAGAAIGIACAAGLVLYLFLRRRFAYEKTLVERDARARHLIDTASDAILTLDESGRILTFNPAAERLFQCAAEQAAGRSFQTLIPNPYPDHDYRRETPFSREVTAFRNDGTTFPADLVLSEIVLADRRLLSAIVRDATARYQAQEELRRERNFASAVLDSAGALIVVLDREGRIVRFNRSAEETTGYAFDQVRGKTIWSVLLSASDAEERRDAFAGVHTEQGTHTVECLCLCKSGVRRIVWTNTALGSAGVVEHLVCLGIDVTERRLLEERLLQSEKMEAIGRLAGGIAHDFNNLLTAITGYSELLLDTVPEGHPLRHDLGEIKGAGERAASLTRQLLAFSRRQVLQPRVIDLNSIIMRIENILRRLIGEDLRLIVSLDQDLSRVRADPGQIEQVILNLALNGRDAMPGGGELTIRTENVPAAPSDDDAITAGGPQVMIEVSDTGCGMDEETQARLFEPFFTTKEQGTGTGLGLSTVYGIVKQSGGTIAVESRVGQGTVFRVFLPRERAQLDVAKPAAPQDVRGGTETILVVEDQPEVRSLTAKVLRGKGYAIIEARDANEAASGAECNGHIDLLLTDVVLPRASGPALAAQLAARRPGLRTLYISGYTDEEILRKSGVSPEDPFLQKPFSAENLLRKVREILDAQTT